MRTVGEDGWRAWDPAPTPVSSRNAPLEGWSAAPQTLNNREADAPAPMRADFHDLDDDYEPAWMAAGVATAARVASAAAVGVGALFAGTFLF
jgi:hypothetical protein